MEIFEELKEYEQLVFCNDPKLGLKAIICIHSTALGPALGGCRLFHYSSDEEAIKDVLRLARGMTYKSAVAGLNWGGGKSVIIADPTKINRENIFRAFGSFVEGLNGRYITAEDVNTNPTDMFYINRATDYVVGLSDKSGDPSIATAKGVYHGIKAAAKHHLEADTLQGLRIAVQGLGHVATHLIEMLHREGATLIVTDLDKNKCDLAHKSVAATVVAPEEILTQECDIFAPCAMGGVVNEKNVDSLKTKIIAGCANNVLDAPQTEKALIAKGILYAPDYVINAGGLINVTQEFGMSKHDVEHKIQGIYHTLTKVFELAKQHGITNCQAADLVAKHRIHDLKRLGSIFNRRNVYSPYVGK